jgi:hypothetical protein
LSPKQLKYHRFLKRLEEEKKNTKYYCKFCKSKLNREYKIFFIECKSCQYHICKNGDQAFFSYNRKFAIILPYGHKITALYKATQSVLHVNEVLDVTPSNVDQVIEKLLKLKAFS